MARKDGIQSQLTPFPNKSTLSARKCVLPAKWREEWSFRKWARPGWMREKWVKGISGLGRGSLCRWCWPPRAGMINRPACHEYRPWRRAHTPPTQWATGKSPWTERRTILLNQLNLFRGNNDWGHEDGGGVSGDCGGESDGKVDLGGDGFFSLCVIVTVSAVVARPLLFLLRGVTIVASWIGTPIGTVKISWGW